MAASSESLGKLSNKTTTLFNKRTKSVEPETEQTQAISASPHTEKLTVIAPGGWGLTSITEEQSATWECIKNRDKQSLQVVFNKYEKLNCVSGDGDDATFICEALWENTTVKELRFVSNIGDIGARALGLLLKNNTHIDSIELLNCHIGTTGIKLIADAIRTSTTLKALLLLGSNPIQDTGMLHLSSALSEHPSITCICMYGQEELTNTGWTNLGMALASMPHLKHLDISENNLSSSSAIKGIFKKFNQEHKLETLFLRKNMLSYESASKLAKMISTHISAEIFEIWDYDEKFKVSSAEILLSTISTNKHFVSVTISCNDTILKEIEESATVKQLTFSDSCFVRIGELGGKALILSEARAASLAPK